jgi:hypothetical protein
MPVPDCDRVIAACLSVALMTGKDAETSPLAGGLPLLATARETRSALRAGLEKHGFRRGGQRRHDAGEAGTREDCDRVDALIALPGSAV